MPVAFETLPVALVSKTSLEDYKVPITSVLSDVEKYGAVVVTKNDDYFGMIDDREIAKRGIIDITESYSTGKLARSVPIVRTDTPIQDIINYFYKSSARALPYMKENRVLGIVKRDAILRAILSLHLISAMKVKEVMSTPFFSIDSDANIAQARSAMEKNKVSRLVVLSNKKLFGLITYKDIINYTARMRERKSKVGRSMPESATRVADVCERNLYSIGKEEGVDNAIRSLVEHNISSLLITKGEQPLGIITVKDVLEAALGNGNAPRENIMISGLDDYNEEYREEIVDTINNITDKVDRFSKIKVDNISVNFKRVKTKGYEITARLELERGEEVYASAAGYTLERTLKSLEDKLYKEIAQKKNRMVTTKKELGATNEQD